MDKNNKSLSHSSTTATNTSPQTEERRIALNLSRRNVGDTKPVSTTTSVDSSKQTTPQGTQRTLNTSQIALNLSNSAQSTPTNAKVNTLFASVKPTLAEGEATKVESTVNVKQPESKQVESKQVQTGNVAQATPSNIQEQAVVQKPDQASQEQPAQKAPQASITAKVASQESKQTEAPKAVNVAQEAKATKNAKASNKGKSGPKSSSTPPWMAQYQKKTEAPAATDDAGVHIDLTSKTKKEQVERDTLDKQHADFKSELAQMMDNILKSIADPKLTKQQEQRLKEIEEYKINNSFNLDLFAFQKNFDNIDKFLSEYLNEHFDLIQSLINEDTIADYAELHLNEDNLDLFTSKKSKYKHKERVTEEQLESAINEYLRFKYSGVFKAVCLYQLVCEQFRVELFNELEKQCRDFSSDHDKVAMGELQRLIDEVEPIEVAANKLMRFSLSECQIVGEDLINSAIRGRDAGKYVVERNRCDQLANRAKSQEAVLRDEIKEYSDFNDKLFAISPEEVGDDPELQEMVNKANDDGLTEEERKELVEPSKAEQYAYLYSKSALSSRNGKLPFHCKQLQEISSILSTFDGYYPDNANTIENVDDAMLSTGYEWPTELGSHLSIPGAPKDCKFLDWVLYWRLYAFSDMLQRGFNQFINADKCVDADQNYIFACPESNLKRNLEQLNLCTRQNVGKRELIFLKQKPTCDKDINVNFNEFVDVTETSFSMLVHFIVGLTKAERLIFSAILSGFDNKYEMLLTIDNVRAKLAKNDDECKAISDSDIFEFSKKLLSTVFLERIPSSRKKRVFLDNTNFNIKVRITPTLIKHLDEAKQMLKMHSTIASLSKRMNQELLYLNPALRTMMECCETLVRRRSVSTTSNILKKMETTLQDELAFTKLRNNYLEIMAKEGNAIDDGLDKNCLVQAMQSLPSNIRARMDIEQFCDYLRQTASRDDDDDDDFDFDDFNFDDDDDDFGGPGLTLDELKKTLEMHLGEVNPFNVEGDEIALDARKLSKLRKLIELTGDSNPSAKSTMLEFIDKVQSIFENHFK